MGWESQEFVKPLCVLYKALIWMISRRSYTRLSFYQTINTFAAKNCYRLKPRASTYAAGVNIVERISDSSIVAYSVHSLYCQITLNINTIR